MPTLWDDPLLEGFGKNLRVCKGCQFHYSMSAPERLQSLLDEGVLTEEFDANLIASNPLGFPDYLEKLEQDMANTNLNEAIITGEGLLGGNRIVIGVMDSRFRMASMGSVVGEKLRVQLSKRSNGVCLSSCSPHPAVRACRKAY